MAIRPIDDCEIGDIELSSYKPGGMPEDVEFEILIEKSAPNDDEGIVTLWKRQDDKFQVGIKEKYKAWNVRITGDSFYGRYAAYTSNGAWVKYKEGCSIMKCDPFPLH